MPPPLYAHDPFLALHRALQAPWLDLPAAIASTACEGWAVALLGLAVVGAVERDARRALAVFLPLGLALAVSGGLVQELKELFATPRPLAVYGSRVRIGLEPLFTQGFPSGHASAGAVLASYAALAYGRRLRWIWLLALAGGLSRIYLGAHWALDVLGGWALGASLGTTAYGLTVWAWPRGHLAALRQARAGPDPADGPRSP